MAGGRAVPSALWHLGRAVPNREEPVHDIANLFHALICISPPIWWRATGGVSAKGLAWDRPGQPPAFGPPGEIWGAPPL
jgi:hypothetical protein